MTIAQPSRLDADLRPPHEPVLIGVLAFAFALIFVAPTTPNGHDTAWLSLLLYGATGAVWLIGHRWPASSPWLTFGLLAATLILIRVWYGLPGFLTLLLIPTALIGATIAPLAAVIAAVLESLVLLALWHQGLTNVEGITALVATWAGAALVPGLLYPVRQLSLWSWSHYEQGQRLLDEARQRQSELKDTLEALGYANQQLALANERLAAMHRIAEEAEHSKAAFVANVSHEFRTPLNIIIGLTDLLMEAPQIYRTELPAAVQRDVEVIHRNSEHLASMVNDVLDLSQVEAGELALHREWEDIGALIRSAVSIVEPLAREKQLSIGLDVPADLPLVWCDRRRIRQVVLNLVSNATRFTDEGGIEVSAQATPKEVRVSVRDTGAGLSPSSLARIFEPFNQGNGSIPAHNQGSGLGLSISRQFVQMHQGTITVDSALGEGSEFVFTLPIEPAPDFHAPADRWIADGWSARRTRARVAAPELKRRLMVIDAVGGVWPVLERYAHDLTLVPVSDLAEAQQRMAASAAQGLLMNIADPTAVWPALQSASHALPDTPITACSLPSANARALAAGALGHLIKPLDQSMIQAVLQEQTPRPRRVLVVDDEPDALDLMVRLLRRCDETIEVLTATSGREALAQVLARQPDLVLLDIVLPDLNGWTVLHELRTDQRTREVPVVLVSAQDPRDEPLATPFIAAGRSRGLSLTMLLRCSQTLSEMMMQPD